jgi:hypothetical protein
VHLSLGALEERLGDAVSIILTKAVETIAAIGDTLIIQLKQSINRSSP